MYFTWNIVVGNGISFVAGIFLIVSYYVNDVKKAYKYQFLNAFVLAISSIFFLSWTGVTTLAIASARNAMVYKDKLTLNWTIFFLVISVVLGVLVNSRGFVGLLPVIAIVQITICNYLLKSIRSIKLSFIINSLLYIVYFFAILDFTSAAAEIITVVIGAVSLIKLIHKTDG